MKQDNLEDIYELSPMQQGMLFHTIAAPNSGMYFEQFCYTLQTQLDVSAFQKAWQRIVERHPILRTSFFWENFDKPYQVVYRRVNLPWEFQDWRELSLQEQQNSLEVFLKADRERGFELSLAPLIRLALIQVGDRNYKFVFSYHHILMEGWSLTWLWKEFYSFYNAFCQRQDLRMESPRPYKEYIVWLQQQDLSQAEAFWRKTLKGFTVPTPLVVEKTLSNFSAQEEDDYHRQQTHLSATLTNALKSFARKHHLTLNILIKGAWAILLSRYSAESDIVFGTTSSGRPAALAEAESMVGLFINTLPLRVQVPSNAFLLPWLKKLQTQEVQMRQYEYSPLMQIQQWSEIPRGLPLFESLLVFNNFFTEAVVFEDEQLTYCELNARANQLAYYLRALGVKPEVLVGICVERSLSMIIGLLAILKAGGVYVPLDPSYPQERLTFILENAKVPVLLTQASLLAAMPQHKAQVICLDTDWQANTHSTALPMAQQSQENHFSQLTPDNLAYVIYTSGSTGKPKGVQISHRALSNFLFAMKQSPGITKEDTLLAVTTYSFDIAALELFLPIIAGARLVIVSREIASDGTQFSATLTDSKATVMQATPATWRLLLAAGWGGNDQLKILCGGEALPAHLANQLRQWCHSLWNMYGPTETTIWSTASKIETDSTVVPISHPIANTQLYILDPYNQLVPVSVTGELHIGGEGLARGYCNRADLTAEKFIPNPFSKEAARLYKTGDLVRYLPNGEIEYIGRIDHQVKIRGFRIELGEIEALISQHPAVRETVVIVRKDSADSQSLIAYIVLNSEQKLAIIELRSFLESKLLNYMMPSAFVILEELPLTPNGKVDRKALPAPDKIHILSESDVILPSTPIEQILGGIWTEVLGIENINIYNNFFELGGHSLIATRVISQIRRIFQVELPLRWLFEKPTIAGLAKEIEKAIQVGLGVETTNIERIERSQQLPLSFAQQRLWFLDQLEPNNTAYNIFSAVHLLGALNIGALEQSLNEIIKRHEALRTSFQTVDGQPTQIITPTLTLNLPVIDLSEWSLLEREKEIHWLAKQEVLQPFDLAQCPLLRATLLRLNAEEYIILLTMHHIISDAWSIGVLVEEVAALYPAFCAGKPSPLPELPIQYADFAVWQRQWLQGEVLQTQLYYWKQQLGSTYPRLTLPKPPLHSTVEISQGAKQSFTLSQDLTEAINLLSRQEEVTLFMTLLAVFQVLLYCFTGTEDIRVGSPIANRNRVEIEKLIGFFINTLVLRIDLSGNPSFQELLMRSRQVTLEAYAHQDLPFEKLVEELQPERNLNHHPLYQAWFVLQNTPMPQLELPGLTLTPLEIESGTARHDLLLEIWESLEGLNGTFEYKTNLFDKASISRLIRYFEILVRHIVAQPDTTLNELATMLAQTDREHQLIQKQELQATEHHKLKTSKRKAVRN